MKSRTGFIISTIFTPTFGAGIVSWIHQESFIQTAATFYTAWIIMALLLIGPSEMIYLMKNGEFRDNHKKN